MIYKRTIDHLLCGRSLLYEIFNKKGRSVGFDKKQKNFFRPTVCFFQGSSETQLARSFSWPYVDPPSKSATASNDKSSADVQKYQKQIN